MLLENDLIIIIHFLKGHSVFFLICQLYIVKTERKLLLSKIALTI